MNLELNLLKDSMVEELKQYNNQEKNLLEDSMVEERKN